MKRTKIILYCIYYFLSKYTLNFLFDKIPYQKHFPLTRKLAQSTTIISPMSKHSTKKETGLNNFFRNFNKFNFYGNLLD